MVIVKASKASENSKLHESSRESTSLAAFVAAIIGHKNSDLDYIVVIVNDSVDVPVIVLVKVTNLVSVAVGVHK
jgi:hypothetical protein